MNGIAVENNISINKMEAGSEFMKSVLRFITGESEDICRLCLASTDFEAISLADTAAFDTPYFEGFATYEDMLAEFGGPEDDLMPLQLCSHCAERITQSYLFKKLSQYSNELWKENLLKINNALDHLNKPREDATTQMICLIMEENENNYFTSRKSTKNKCDVIAKVKSYISQRKFKMKATKVSSISTECLRTKVLSQNKKRKRRVTQYPCSQCPQVFKTGWTLKIHTERYHIPKNINCPKCPKMLSTERLLKMHDDLEHTAASCKECFAKFPNKSKLNTHMYTHGVYKCEICDKIFTHKVTHRIHEKRCGQPRPRLFCDICNASYKFKTALRSHMRSRHGFGATPVACPYCDKKFEVLSRLKAHIVKHTRERNFHCDICGGLFVTRPALNNHMRLHTGERPFECDLCPERFLSASRRMEHKRRKHLGPEKECPYCDRKFLTKFCLEKHIERHLNPQSRLFVGNAKEYTKSFSKCVSDITS